MPAGPKRSATAGSGSAASAPAVRMPSASSSSVMPRVEAQAADRHAADEAGRAVCVDHARAAGSGLDGGGLGGEAAGTGADPAAGREQLPGGVQQAAEAAVHAQQAVGAEQRAAGLERLDGGADRLQAGQQLLGGIGNGTGVGGDQPDSRAASDRLAGAHPGPHAEGGRGGIHLAHQRRAARLRGQRRRDIAQRPAHRHPQREAGDERADQDAGAFRQGLSSIGEHVFVCNGRDDTSGSATAAPGTGVARKVASIGAGAGCNSCASRAR